MIRTRTAALIGGLASAAAIVATAASAGQVGPALAGAYAYPNASGIGLDEAVPMTLTYLFVLAGTGLIVAFAYLLIHPLARSRVGWWIALGLSALGLAVAAYNAVQVEIPPIVKVVFFLPPLAGIAWLAISRQGIRAEDRVRTGD